MKVLAVDDDIIGLEIVTKTLTAVGYNDLTVVSSGTEALKEIETSSQPFDCFLLDIQMPEMDGIELCSHIRKMDDYKSSPILMITAMTERKHIEGAFNAGANDYINKPFDPLELSVRVRLAEKMVNGQKAFAGKELLLNSMRFDMENILQFTIRETINIKNVPSMVEKLALENYLLQLSRKKTSQTRIAAFAIKDFEKIFEGSSPSNMYCILSDVAHAITENIKTVNYLITYCGSGIFACVTTTEKNEYPDNLENSIQSTINDMKIECNNGLLCDVTVLMGLPSRSTSLWSSGPSLDPLHSALEAADSKRYRRSQQEQSKVSYNLLKYNRLEAG